MTPRLRNSLVFAWSVSAALWLGFCRRLAWEPFAVGICIGFSLAVMIVQWAMSPPPWNRPPRDKR